MADDIKSINEAYNTVVKELNLGPGAEQNVFPTQNEPKLIKISNQEENEGLDNSPPDVEESEAYMAKNELFKTYKTCKELHDLLGDGEDIEPWIFSKITVAASMLDGVKHYIEYNKFREKGSFDGEHASHEHSVVSRIKNMLHGESKDVIEGVLRQAIFNLEALSTISAKQ
jgi:hypothetical protein